MGTPNEGDSIHIDIWYPLLMVVQDRHKSSNNSNNVNLDEVS